MTRGDITPEREKCEYLFSNAQSGVVVTVDAVLPCLEPAGSPRPAKRKAIHGATTSRLCRFLSSDSYFLGGASVLHVRRTVDVLKPLQQTGRLQSFREVSINTTQISWGVQLL